MEEARPVDDAERLVSEYADQLFRIAYCYMKNRSEAEDAVQTAFLRYLEKRPVFESEEHQKAWLIRVTVNICRNRLRSFWFRKTTALTENLFGFLPEESELLDAVTRLPIKYRSVIVLYYFEGYPLAQAAKILRVPEGTVGSRLQRARKRLKSMLGEECENE